MEPVRRLAAAFDDAKDGGAAGAGAGEHSSTSAPAPSAITKPSRSLLNGRAADDGGSFRVDNADSRLNRIRLSGFTEASVPTTRAASHSPRRIASTPSWIAVPPEAHAVDVAIGEPLVPNRAASASPTEANRKRSNQGSKCPVSAARIRSCNSARH